MRTQRIRKRVFLTVGVITVLVLFSSFLNALQPVQAQTALPNFNLVGNAILHQDRLGLTINERLQTGAAWLPKQQVAGGFEAIFDWQITRANPQRGAEGFAFVIHNADTLPDPDIALGMGRHGLGYQDIPNSLAVEFDTTQTPAIDFGHETRGDHNDNHISVQTRGQEPNSAHPDFSLGRTTQTQPAVPFFANGRHKGKIVYKPGNLAVYVDDMAKPLLTVAVDLGTTLRLDEGTAWVGFTAATGRRSQAHDILSFSFVGTGQSTPTPTPAPGATTFTAQLDGSQEIPQRDTPATGNATFQIRDETQIDFALTVVNIENIVAAHIHCAPVGEIGSVGITLIAPVDPGGGAVDAFSTAGTLTQPDANNGCGWADMASVIAAMRDGLAYVNVHTDDGEDPPNTGAGDFSDGEIRGQITAASQQ